ncbi:C2 domain protein [Oesophagostomum dentatum]|uniref:C2 domain protein n=1 Tax=Oesophagostomum dentatum TaxID=61180 RepID=A0A0B1T1J4_OESDE|nr:C2 domain protein [Oesophagostomum dentatum]
MGPAKRSWSFTAELSGLVGGSEAAAPPPATAPPPASAVSDNAMLARLRGLLTVYEKMLATSNSEGNTAKQRRHQRSVTKLKELISKAERGMPIDESEIPPTPPTFTPQSASDVSTPTSSSGPTLQPPPIPKRTSSSPAVSSEADPHPPPVPARSSSTAFASEKDNADAKKQKILAVLKRRRDEYVANGKAAVAAMDKTAAKQYVETAKMFDQALAALDSADVDELDLSEVPPSPPPYRKPGSAPAAPAVQPKPTTFLGGLQSRMERFQSLAQKAKQEGNDRKARMNTRMVEQYAAAIRDAKAGRPVAVADLPSLPDMPPLPPQKPATAPKGPAPGMHPPPAVGPLAPSGQPGKSRNATQLEFLIERQKEFRHAAMQAKSKGNIELAKKYLLESKGFDKMIAAARAGLPVSIKSTPIPPQVTTSQTTLQPKIVPAAKSSTGVEGRGEALSMMENALIEQVQLAENSRMRFTRLGDVGKVKLFEEWARAAKQDLLLVREVAKQGLNLPKFHYEMRHIPSADLFPDLAEDVLELSIIRCRDVPLPSGYEPSDANLFVKYLFPYPTDANQSGKTKYISGTQNPEFNELIMLQIGSRKARGHKLYRLLKRAPLKLEVYQKGSFLRSDKLLGTCEWRLDQLESHALLEESLPLKEGRKAVGGLLTLRIRVREPLGDAKLTTSQHRWLVLDN